MSRVKDLISLIQTTNEIYLLAPDRHIRSAFIQIDDLFELIMKSWLQIDTNKRQQNCLATLEAAHLIKSQSHRNRFREFCDCTCGQAFFESALGIADGSSKQTELQNILDQYQPLNTDQLQQQCLAALEAAHLIRNRNDSIRFREFYECICNQTNFEQSLGITHNSKEQITLQTILNMYHPLSTWQPTKADGGFKNFSKIIAEVKDRNPLPHSQSLHEILDRVQERRENRNNFFHNQNLVGLTVDDEQCLQAFHDLYQIMDCLFPGEISENATPLLRAQISAIEVRNKTVHDASKRQRYNDLLNNWPNKEERQTLKVRGEIKVRLSGWAYEYCVIHYYPTAFYDSLIQAELIAP